MLHQPRGERAANDVGGAAAGRFGSDDEIGVRGFRQTFDLIAGVLVAEEFQLATGEQRFRNRGAQSEEIVRRLLCVVRNRGADDDESRVGGAICAATLSASRRVSSMTGQTIVRIEELVAACGGTAITGTFAYRITASVTDPMMSRRNPVRPCVPMTIRSASDARASARMPSSGGSTRMAMSYGTAGSMFASASLRR